MTDWVALESNPDAFNAFAWGGGMPKKFGFVDVYGTDEDLLAMVPTPVFAVTLLFDCSDENIAKAKEEQQERLERDGQNTSDKVFWMEQSVGNACGTIAVIHSVVNNAEALALPPESKLGKFRAENADKKPGEIGESLGEDEDLAGESGNAAEEGQTEAPEAGSHIVHHFIAFVEVEGDLYELDGGKAFPINHGPTEGSLLTAATKVIKANFIDVSADAMGFNMMALCQLGSEDGGSSDNDVENNENSMQKMT